MKDVLERNLSLLASPCCRGAMLMEGEVLVCSSCSARYPAFDGIADLIVPSTRSTLDRSRFALRSRREAASTLRRDRCLERGFIGSPRVFYALYALLLVSLIAGKSAFVIGLLLVLLSDWVFFRLRRGRTLARYRLCPLRVTTAGDIEEVERLYRKQGKEPPSMQDWLELAASSSFPSSGKSGFDDERYVEIAREFSAIKSRVGVVVDVGANDGRATARFGVGEGCLVVGVDVSRKLLEQFRRNVPAGLPLRAEGQRLPLRDESVDFLFASETLEHMSDPGEAVAEFVRVLKPRGRLMVQSPNAHRLRNLNLFHVIELTVSLAFEQVLQKKEVHPNTWHNALTYHWDFSRRDCLQLAEGKPVRFIHFGTRSFFFPRLLLRGGVESWRRKEKLMARLPLVRWFGADIVLVLEKVGGGA